MDIRCGCQSPSLAALVVVVAVLLLLLLLPMAMLAVTLMEVVAVLMVDAPGLSPQRYFEGPWT